MLSPRLEKTQRVVARIFLGIALECKSPRSRFRKAWSVELERGAPNTLQFKRQTLISSMALGPRSPTHPP